MIPGLTHQFQAQLDAVEKAYERAEESTLSYHRFLALAHAAVVRVAGEDSTYVADLDTQCKLLPRNVPGTHIIMGIVRALAADVKAGFLTSAEELIHGDVFSDFLEMASHLLEEKYKDAAAVIGGGTLEAHLRQLCQKHGVDVEAPSPSGDLRPKKADRMNADLAKAKAYSKLDQKNVTAWLDLRNKAAHAQYDQYTEEEVRLFIESVRSFITRNPA